jgi:hypothetical protein
MQLQKKLMEEKEGSFDLEEDLEGEEYIKDKQKEEMSYKKRQVIEMEQQRARKQCKSRCSNRKQSS